MRKSLLYSTLAMVVMISILSSSSVQATNFNRRILLGSPSLVWDCAVGDAMVLNFNTVVDLDVSEDVWDTIDDWLVNDMNITAFTSRDVYAVYQALLPKNLGLKFTIDTIKGYSFNRSSNDGFDDTYEEGKIDVINATLNLRNGTSSPWLTPAQYLNNTLDIVGPFAYNYMNATGQIPEGMTEEIFVEYAKYQMTQDMGVIPRPFELSTWETDVVEYYLENDTVVPVDNGPIDTSVQPGESGPGAFLILPHAIDFADMYNDFRTAMDGMLSSMGMTWNQLVASLGFSSIVIKRRSIAISFNLADINETGPLYPMISQGLAAIDMVGIHNLTGSVKIGIEWNDKGILSALGFYVEGSAVIDMTAMIPDEGPEPGEDTPVSPVITLPPIINETFPISIAQTIAGDGITPPSIEQISNGIIGAERPGSTPPVESTPPTDTTPAFNIPGYPVGIVAATVLVTTSVIIYKKRRVE